MRSPTLHYPVAFVGSSRDAGRGDPPVLSQPLILCCRMEHHANLLWIPIDSPYNTNQAWLDAHFKNGDRAEIVIFQSENVLTPKALKECKTLSPLTTV